MIGSLTLKVEPLKFINIFNEVMWDFVYELLAIEIDAVNQVLFE